MREFAVTLRCGLKFVVKADRVVLMDRQFLALSTSPSGTDGEGEVSAETVALFDRSQVMAVVAKDHLVSEEQTDPIPGRFSVEEPDDGIPF
ncbi:MAG TPA: hypothetical protein VKE74_18220 [Gemmataceae bacterium]|nr:hypothetical protein [Gemmataceae bacterium]